MSAQQGLFDTVELTDEQLEAELLRQLVTVKLWFSLCDLESYVFWYGPPAPRSSRPRVLAALSRLQARGLAECDPDEAGEQDFDGWRGVDL